MKTTTIDQDMLNAIVSGVVVNVTQQITSGLTGGLSGPMSESTVPPATTGKRPAKPRRTVNGPRATYRTVKSGKAGAKLIASMPERCQPAMAALVAAGSAGVSIPGLMTSTGRTSKQLENDVYWLKVNGFAVKN